MSRFNNPKTHLVTKYKRSIVEHLARINRPAALQVVVEHGRRSDAARERYRQLPYSTRSITQRGVATVEVIRTRGVYVSENDLS